MRLIIEGFNSRSNAKYAREYQHNDLWNVRISIPLDTLTKDDLMNAMNNSDSFQTILVRTE